MKQCVVLLLNSDKHVNCAIPVVFRVVYNDEFFFFTPACLICDYISVLADWVGVALTTLDVPVTSLMGQFMYVWWF